MSRRVVDWMNFTAMSLESWREEGRQEPLVLYSGKKYISEDRLKYFRQFLAEDEKAELVMTKQRLPRTGQSKTGRTMSVYFIVITRKDPEEMMSLFTEGEEGMTVKEAQKLLKEEHGKKEKS